MFFFGWEELGTYFYTYWVGMDVLVISFSGVFFNLKFQYFFGGAKLKCQKPIKFGFSMLV